MLRKYPKSFNINLAYRQRVESLSHTPPPRKGHAQYITKYRVGREVAAKGKASVILKVYYISRGGKRKKQ